jgi:hypothetical protein
LKTFVNTRFVNKVQMFEEFLKFKQAICHVMGGKKHEVCNSNQQILKAHVWAIIEIITTCLNFMLIICMMNQSRGH